MGFEELERVVVCLSKEDEEVDKVTNEYVNDVIYVQLHVKVMRAHKE